MTKPLIVVTRKWPKEVENALKQNYRVELNSSDQAFSQAALKSAFETADAVCPTVTDDITADVMSGAKVKIIANYGVGFGHIDLAMAQDVGITVTNTPDVLTDCTADLAMMLMLMAARRAGEGERQLRAGRWDGWRPTHLMGSRLSGKRLGIVGFGRIGQAVALRAHRGFGMQVFCYGRSPISEAALTPSQATVLEDINSVFSECDFVSIHCPGGNENRGLISADLIAQMQDHAILVNTSRGEVVDENALAAALKARQIAAAGLDVYSDEPSVPNALVELENVVLLPHLGSATSETRAAMGYRVLQNLNAYFGGEDPPDRVI